MPVLSETGNRANTAGSDKGYLWSGEREGRLPNSFCTKGCTLKGSKSSICSPVPINITGLCVAATLQKEQHAGESIQLLCVDK